MTRPYLLTVLMCSTLFLTPNSAEAAIDAAGADAVKKMVKKMVEDQFVQSVKRQSPAARVKMAGDYVVVPKDTFYAVTVPHIIIDVPKPNDSKSIPSDKNTAFTIDYGSLNMNIMPGPVPNQWRMAVAMPSPIRFKMEPSKNIDVYQTTKRAQILWDDTQKMIIKNDILIDDIQIKLNDKPVPLTFGSLAYTTNATETSPGIFNGTSNISLKNISMDIGGDLCPVPCQNPGTIKVGEFFGNGTYAGYDHKMAQTFNEKMSSMIDAGYNPEKPATPESFMALWKDFMTYGLAQVDKVDGTVGVRDIAVNIKPTNPAAKPIVFTFKKLAYNGGISDWKSDKSHLNFGTGFDGMTIAPETMDHSFYKLLSSSIPTTANQKIDITNFPHKKLMEQLGTMAQNFMASMGPAKCEPDEKPEQCAKRSKETQQTQMLGLQAMMTLPQLFAEAGTKVTVHVDGDAPKLTVLVDGDFTANAAAIYSGVGKLKAVLGGIDTLTTELQSAAKDPTMPPSDAKQIQDMLGGLTTLQMFGQQGTDAKGNPARIYDLILDDKGAIKLNGSDLSTFGKMGTPLPPAVPPAADAKP